MDTILSQALDPNQAALWVLGQAGCLIRSGGKTVVIDTAGYHVTFPNSRNVYQTADTGWSPLLLQTSPKAEVLLVCINGKRGNLDVAEAVELTAHLSPRYAIPMHYDLMALNSENPHSFAYFMRRRNPAVAVRILTLAAPFIW